MKKTLAVLSSTTSFAQQSYVHQIATIIESVFANGLGSSKDDCCK